MKIIGIDPDLHLNGMATLENDRYTELRTISFPDLCTLMSCNINNPEVLFVIEDVNKHKPTFPRGKHSQSVYNNISQKVGMVKGIGTKIVEMLEHYHCNYELVPPLKSGKLKAEYFDRLTGWVGRSNQDNRDAAMLIFKYKK